MSDDSTNAEGSEDACAELKPYLEAQIESIVYAIQSVLSGVRAPTPSPSLNENLTQIITIVSSIIALAAVVEGAVATEAVLGNAESVKTTMTVPKMPVVAAIMKALPIRSTQLKTIYPSCRILSPLLNLQSTRLSPIIFGLGKMG